MLGGLAWVAQRGAFGNFSLHRKASHSATNATMHSAMHWAAATVGLVLGIGIADSLYETGTLTVLGERGILEISQLAFVFAAATYYSWPGAKQSRVRCVREAFCSRCSVQHWPCANPT